VLVLQGDTKIHLKTLGLKVRSGFGWLRMGSRAWLFFCNTTICQSGSCLGVILVYYAMSTTQAFQRRCCFHLQGRAIKNFEEFL